MRGIICIMSFMFVLGTIGAIECDTINIGQAIIQAIIGLIIFYFTSKKYWIYNEKETQLTTAKRF